MIVVLVETPNALRVYDDDIHFLAIVGVTNQWLRPNPESFGAGVDSWAYAEARIVLEIQKHSVQQVALSSTIHASNSYNSNWTSNLLNYTLSFFVYFEFLRISIPNY